MTMRPALAATTILALATAPLSAQPALEDIIIAMPNFTFTSTPNFIAEELGLWAKYGLRVKIIQIAGVGATNAVIAGSADFVQAGGSTLTRAAARGQRLLAIANTAERNIVAITMRKEVAEAAGFDAKAPIEKRAQVLRGKTFGVGAINANPHAYLLAVASRGGVKPDELRVTALEGNAMWAAFQSKQIDGMSNSPPWPLKPVVDGLSVVIASGPNGDPPNAVNFAYNVILAKPETCQKRKAGLRRGGPGDEGGGRLYAHAPGGGDRDPRQEISEPGAGADRGGVRGNPQVDAEGAGRHQRGAGQRRRFQRRGRHDEGVGQAEVV